MRFTFVLAALALVGSSNALYLRKVEKVDAVQHAQAQTQEDADNDVETVHNENVPEYTMNEAGQFVEVKVAP